MNVKRFTGRSSREALQLVQQASGDDAIVLPTRPCEEGREVVAMGAAGMRQIETLSPTAPALAAARAAAGDKAPGLRCN